MRGDLTGEVTNGVIGRWRSNLSARAELLDRPVLGAVFGLALRCVPLCFRIDFTLFDLFVAPTFVRTRRDCPKMNSRRR